MPYNKTNSSKDKQIVPVDYTSRDFDSIKARLIEFVKTKYPNTYRDFNDTSFGSLMIDLISYLGDNLSFYIDYAANESNPVSAIEKSNVVEGFKSLGYFHRENRTAVGEVELYIPIPADSSGRPDSRYMNCTVLSGAKFRTTAGAVFTLNEDINLNSSDASVYGQKYSTSDGSRATYWVLKVKGQVISGQEEQYAVEVGSPRRFLKIEIPNDSVSEIVSVQDTEGNEYYQVDYLTQNTILRAVASPDESDNSSPSILKKVPVPRRFIVDTKEDRTFIQFGYGSDKDLKTNQVADPSEVVLKITGKKYVSLNSFDPTKLTSTDKFGVAPSNTTLTVSYRYNSEVNVNAPAGAIDTILSSDIVFNDVTALEQTKIDYMKQNMEVYNDLPVNGDVTIPSTQEIKHRARGIYAAQSRAVTVQDYISSVYAMPSRFGTVKRCAVIRDDNDLRRNLNLHIIAESADGKLQAPSMALKNNVKTWLDSVRMVSDSIDIFDAKIVNFGIQYNVIPKTGVSLNSMMGQIRIDLYDYFKKKIPDIGEYFYLSDVYAFLVNHRDVKHVNSVAVVSKTGAGYSDILYNIDDNMSPLGKFVYIPKDFIWEIKNPEDISWVEQSTY